MRITTAALPLLLSTTAVVTAYDPDCGSSSYTGFAIKSSSSCASYVYCQSGGVTSETSCPDGLLFNGGVGRGGICTWPEMVVCEEDDNEDGGAATTSTTTSTSSATTSSTSTNGSSNGNGNGNNALPSPWKQYLDTQSGNYYYFNPDTDVTQWQRPSAPAQSNGNNNSSGNNNSGDNNSSSNNANPNNYYCGQSRTDAAAHCRPCPSGSLLDCEDVTHGCFANVDSCAAASVSTNGGGRANSNSNNGNTLSLSDFAQNQNPTTQTTSTTSTQTNPAPSPSIVIETQAPSLPPWTNAPYASYKGPKRSKTVIGYYASWQWYDRNKFADPQNIDFSKYDRINYAFFQPDKQGNLYGTDEWADPQLLFGPYDYASEQVLAGPDRNYYCSWDGPSEATDHNCAVHRGGGILDLAHAAGAEVMPSIGGWTLSDNFPTIASTEEGRRNFARNCVKLIEAYGFDGIDIDWEYPAYEDHSGTPEDTVNYTYFLQAIRDALDTLGQSKGRYYPLTAALPCGPDKIEKIQVDKIKDILDELNLMSYDLHGAWDVLTGVNAPMFDQGWTDTTKRWSVHGCTEAYLEHGVALEKINLGLPFYGRSFRKATGFKQVHEGADDINYHLDEGSPQYFNIVKALGRMKTYRHEKTQTQYATFEDTGGLVSYDDARAICDKVHYANERGMHGFLIWEISGDMLENGDTPLIDATNDKINNPNLDCSTLRDPLWALSDNVYRYAPPEPEKVDWTSVNPLNLASPMGYSNGNPVPASAPSSPTLPTPAVNNSPTVTNSNGGVPQNNPSPMASSPSSGGGSNDCPPDHTGYWASADCTQYMYCNAGAVVGALMPCVPGTLFDVTTATCAHAANVPSCARR